ncbi:MAG: hypothetical protein MZW92_34955 [Comamonadaceae bacterium]|nr:hypothetical protein [Comamonadaceae bacterium]
MECSLQRRYPGCSTAASQAADAGETVRVEAADGRFLAWGAYSPSSTIRVRAWSFDEAERIDARLLRAPHRRARWRCARACRSPATACAWCTARPTACPGLVVDRYGDTLSAQFLRRRRRALEATRSPTRCCAATGARAAVRTLGLQRARASKAWRRVTGWLRGDGDRPR